MTQNNQNKLISSIVYFIVCLIVMVLFDILLTNYILHNIFIDTHSFNLIDIVYVQNTGAAFSSFQQFTPVLVLLSILAIIFILFEFFKNAAKYTLPMYFAIAMLSSGIICNTYERISLGYVRDFLSFKTIEFPVFNISDVFINFAVVMMIVLVVTKKYKR